MTEDVDSWQRKRRRLWVILVVLAAILAVSIVPPLLSISRYKSQVAHLMSASLGRPVRLSSVELRLLPRPGFVLTNLTVEEDPTYGAEPFLHANTVIASIRLLSLWRGRLEIGSVSVDEASLNLVRTREGSWNLESFLRTATAQAGAAEGSAGRPRAVPMPYLEATNSRINIKIGAEKLPFSLISTDLSFWQQEPGEWRVQLRGQPARTDLSLDLADTGIVRLQASARRAPDLRQMPVHLDMDWREAQLGQLTRLIFGSDPGWRGDLTGELHLDGTPDTAQVKTRLRATGVHRAEFAPPALVDFDARCDFVYHYSSRALEHLACDSPFGDGRIHLTGELPGGGQSRFSTQLDRLPVEVCLDALRAVRSGFAPGLEARGAISGKIAYAHGPFTGSFTVDGLQLSGDGLRTPIHIPKVVLEPVAASPGWQPGQPLSPALAATVAIPAGGTAPLAVTTRLALSGYQLMVHGQAALARARELARVAGMANAEALEALAGDPVAVDLSAEGPWLTAPEIPFSNILPAVNEAARPATDSLRGTVTLHNANWKADYLASHVLISTATLHLGNGDTRWDPVVFSYGPVKGTASLSLPADCGATEPCPPRFQLQFGDLDDGVLQEAFLGAHEPGTLLSTLIDRLRFSSAPVWPRLEGTVKADSLILGPVTLREPSAALRILPAGAEITVLDAGLLGGRVHGTGTLSMGDKPSYSLTGRFQKLSPAAVGQLLGMRWSGGVFSADGRIDLSGYTDKDLAASAKGTLHFEWRHGFVSAPAASSSAASVPPALARFDRWTADAEIANGAITLKQNQVQQGARKRVVEAAVTLGNPPTVTFATQKEKQKLPSH
jgi:hypothetical protein